MRKYDREAKGLLGLILAPRRRTPVRWLGLALVGTLALACAPISAIGTPAPATPASPVSTSTPLPLLTQAATERPPTATATRRPTATPTATPRSMPAESVWYAPNMGSTDYLELFSRPDDWSVARDKVDVFKFYTQNLLPHPCPICWDNILPAFVEADAFRRLQEWGLDTAIEVGAVKEWGCRGEDEFNAAREVIENVRAHGGEVAYLAMDEPLLGGQHEFGGVSCGLTPAEIAVATAGFVERVHGAYPNIWVGDIEPYPHYSVAQLERWLDLLAANGLTPAFFHLDVDLERVRVEGQKVAADLRALSQYCAEHGIPFGVIFTSNWTQAGSNQAYYDSTMGWVATVAEAMGRPPQVIFQSWQGPAPSGRHEIPINLPQNDPQNYSHVRLINMGLALFGE